MSSLDLTNDEQSTCENYVQWCLHNDVDVIKLKEGLKQCGVELGSVGSDGNACKDNVRKVILCEDCPRAAGGMAGAYDAVRREVVVCANRRPARDEVCGIVRHELVHAHDALCRGVDLLSLDGLVRSEVRAARLVDCNYAHFMRRLRLFPSVDNCVRRAAMRSVTLVKTQLDCHQLDDVRARIDSALLRTETDDV